LNEYLAAERAYPTGDGAVGSTPYSWYALFWNPPEPIGGGKTAPDTDRLEVIFLIERRGGQKPMRITVKATANDSSTLYIGRDLDDGLSKSAIASQLGSGRTIVTVNEASGDIRSLSVSSVDVSKGLIVLNEGSGLPGNIEIPVWAVPKDSSTGVSRC